MDSELKFILNDTVVEENINPAITVLDYLRNSKKLNGTKEGCREGDCGACTVLIGTLVKNKVNYKSVNSCLLPLISINGKHLVTIEGLNLAELNLIQDAMVTEGGTQCGFCTPGFIISLTCYFLEAKNYNYNSALNYLDGNICRCTGYSGIKRAVEKVINVTAESSSKNKIDRLIQSGIIPNYFSKVSQQLIAINNTINDKKPEKIISTKLIVAGGTDLYVKNGEELIDQELNFISSRENPIEKRGDEIIVQASATIEEFTNSKIIHKYFPQIKNSLKWFGSLPIRNRATVGGNIVNGSPIADITNILLALASTVKIVNGKKVRIVKLNKLYLGYKKLGLKKGEIVESIAISIPEGKYFFSCEKVSRREYLDIASVNSSMMIQTKKNIITNVHLSAGGVAPIPKYLEATSLFLIGKELSLKNILDAFKVVKTEISPISDVRGSAEYKTILLRQLILAHFYKLFPHLLNEEVTQ
ncbi:MAG: FAD binding domain-containing protein [Melioribacteraceae bacterium]|nr:FAD binding domain-containing protein [Melioribacteraceae bacterium]